MYGERFLAAFHRNWPASVELQVYVEEPHPMPRDACRRLWDIPGAAAFAERHRYDPAMHGRVARKGWRDREVRNGYSFKFDAWKFYKQIIIPQAAAEGLSDGDILIWLDGDTVTLRPVEPKFFEQLLDGAEVCYLNRFRQHSEIGFWAIRINERTRAFLALMADHYTSDRFIEFDEWHSAYVWDRAREASALKERPLVRHALRGHVWPSTPLARYLRHDKGAMRKGGRHG